MFEQHADAQQNNVISGQKETAFTFRKVERLCSKKEIGELFEGGKSHSMTGFPLRTVFRFVKNRAENDALKQTEAIATAPEKANIKLLISVPKRCFKRAVKRNRVKRQIREAYRKHRFLLDKQLERHCGEELLLSFIWLDDKLHATPDVEKQVCNLLKRLAEKN